MRYFYHTNDKNRVLAHSHYSDPAFSVSGGAVIFGEARDGIQYEYADRLRQWEPEKADDAWGKAVEECGKQRTAQRIERYLQIYYDNSDLDLVTVISGTQQFSGYPWYAYGFTQ